MHRFISLTLICSILSFFTMNALLAMPLLQQEELVQDSSKTVLLYFRFDRSLLEKEYMSNAQSLEKLRHIITQQPDFVLQMDSIIVKASASPEGSPIRNQQLAIERAAAVKTYLMWQYPYLDRNKIITYYIPENWEGLKWMVEEDDSVPYRNQVLEVINMDINPWEKDIRLKQIGGGKAFDYIAQHMLRYLRSGATCVVFYQRPSMEELVLEVEEEDVILEEPVAGFVPLPLAETMLPPDNNMFSYKRPIAFKTNLLFDAATLLNAEIEVPVGKRFSVAGELMFPWWLRERQQNCLEILAGTLEGRYWITPNYSRQDISLGKHNPLSGWFVGVYGSMGKYDLEWKKKGYQGEFYLSAGLSAGYVLPVKRNLNIEFSLSAGYLQTDYWHYQAMQNELGGWCLIKQYPGTFHWFGPTKLKVSLVWYPHFKFSKKGGTGR